MKASDSVTVSSGGGLDGLPREDISGKITPALLKSLESSDWKVVYMIDFAEIDHRHFSLHCTLFFLIRFDWNLLKVLIKFWKRPTSAFNLLELV